MRICSTYRVGLLLVLLTGTLGFTPVHVSIESEVLTNGYPEKTMSALIQEVLERGGTRVEAIDGGTARYHLNGINISFLVHGDTITMSASGMRGAGCSQESIEKRKAEFETTVQEIVQSAAKKTGVPMQIKGIAKKV